MPRKNDLPCFSTTRQNNREKLETLGNCAAKNNYEWNQDQVMRAFGSFMRKFIECADLFGVTVTAQVDGIEVRVIDR